MVSVSLHSSHDLRTWRIRIFAITWLAYVGYYFTRKHLPVVQPLFLEEYGWSMFDLGIVAAAFQLTYAVGQLVRGAVGDVSAASSLARRMIATAYPVAAQWACYHCQRACHYLARERFAQATGGQRQSPPWRGGSAEDARSGWVGGQPITW